MDNARNMEALKRISSQSLVFKKKLGGGSFSTVYRAKYTDEADQTEHMVAVKQLKAGWDITNEAKIHMAAQHKCIVKIYGYVSDDAYKGLVLELCKDGNLSEYLHETDLTLQMTRDQREQLALDIAKGLVFLHQNNIIHRDLKTDNIMLKQVKTRDNETRLMGKITDFGFSTQLPPGETEYLTDKCQGSPGWAAREIYIKNAEKQAYVCTAKVDVFALGMVLSLLARDDEYFPLPNILAPALVMAFIANDGLATITLPTEYSSATTRALIRKCWSRQPSERPDANEILSYFNDGNRLFEIKQ